MANLKVGLAQAVITPPVGFRLEGYRSRNQPSTGILDDLYAKALVLDNGKERLALVVCDLVGFGKGLVQDSRKRIKELTGIKEENIMITATHTHTGPSLGFTGETYIENLKSQIAGAVYAATNSMREARIGVGRGECLTGSNRRNPNSPHGPYFLYSWPEGPMDPTVLVLRIEDLDGSVMGFLVNYSCHAVALGPKELRISRDYPGYALRVLEEAWNQDIIAIFMNGCCGNINPRWVWEESKPSKSSTRPESPEEWVRETRRLGHILGAESLKAAESITDFSSDLELKAARKEVELPLRDEIPEMLLKWPMDPKRKEIVLKKGREDIFDILWELAQGKKSITTEIQVFSIGGILLAGLPGEVFVEIQQEIRKKSETPYTFVSELANDYIFYVVTPKAFEEGGYEPTVAIVAPEAAGILIQNALSLIDKLK